MSERMKRNEQESKRMLRRLEYRNAWRGNAFERIRSLLIYAAGQPTGAAKTILGDIVPIVESGAAPPEWRDMVKTEYPHLIPSIELVFRYDVDGKLRKPMQGGLNRQLTEEENKLIRGHLDLMRKLAHQRAVLDQNLIRDLEDTALEACCERAQEHGVIITDHHDLFADLESIGLEVLEEQAGCWDPTGGVTFGAFVEARIAAAMDNYLAFRRQQLQQGVHPPNCVVCYGVDGFLDGKSRAPAPSDDIQQLTDEQRKLIIDHQPLVRSWRVRRASEINNLAGGTALDHALLARHKRL
jgi:hypothetical protein